MHVRNRWMATPLPQTQNPQHSFQALPARRTHAPWIAPFLGLFLSACYTPLDALPTDTVATAHSFWEEENGFGFAEFFLQAETCTVLNPKTTRFTLNDQAPSWLEFGGRGREPLDAFNANCALPRASWEQTQVPEDPMVFRLADDVTELEFVIDLEGEILRCDFPTCEHIDLATDFRPVVP